MKSLHLGKTVSEEGDQRYTYAKCGETWIVLSITVWRANDWPEGRCISVEELDSTFQRSCRKYFYGPNRNACRAYRVLSLVGALKTRQSCRCCWFYTGSICYQFCYLHISFSYAMICSQVSHSGFPPEKLSHIFDFSICSFSIIMVRAV